MLPYLLEHVVVEFAGSPQGDVSVDIALHDSEGQHEDHRHAINQLVNVQVWVLKDVTLE